MQRALRGRRLRRRLSGRGRTRGRRPAPSRHHAARARRRTARCARRRAELDDLLILDAWTRRHTDETTEVAVAPDRPEDAAPALRVALRALGGRAVGAGLAGDAAGPGSLARR